MLTFAGIPLTMEDSDGVLARFLGQHLRLEDLRLFGNETTPLAGQRNSSQGGNSHIVSLPTPNYPATPALRISTLQWPTGAARWATFLGLATDSQLSAMREAVRGTDRKLLPGQLIVGDSDFSGTIPADGYAFDSAFKQALSTKMWMLTPRCISGVDAAIPQYNLSAALAVTPRTHERIWLVPFVDSRWFLQTKATPSYLYGNVFVSETSVPNPAASPPTTLREYRLEFVGRYSRTLMPATAPDPAPPDALTATDSLTPTAATITTTRVTPGDATTNEAWRITIDKATGGTFTLKFRIPSSLLLPGMALVTTTAQIPFDASPEEIEAAVHATAFGRVRWESLFENLETAIGETINYDVPGAGWGWPDRTELDRPFESLGLVLDAVAHSTGRRLIRDINGQLWLLTPRDSNVRFEANTHSLSHWWRIAGHETLSDKGWSLIDSRGDPEVPPGNPDFDEAFRFRKGQFLPASINVVSRDLTRSTRSGTWRATEITAPTNIWKTDGGRLVINVNIETADTSEFSDLVTADDPATTDVDESGSLNQWSLKATDWVETIHTPSLNNTGKVATAGDAYTKLAGLIAGNYYDWRRRLYDARFVSVLPWRMTGFDDHVEFSLGERIGDVDERGYGGYLAGTRIQSMPLNFGCSDFLNQVGTNCPWTEKFFVGELKESLPALKEDYGDSDVPGSARGWLFLPPMELQGESEPVTRALSGTLTNRSESAFAAGDRVFAHGWACEKDVLAGGGGGSQSQQLQFRVLDWVSDEPLTAPCEAVYAKVLMVSCGSSLRPGDIVIVWDTRLCFFDLPIDLLMGLVGTANWMDSSGFTPQQFCLGAAQIELGDCMWVVHTLCCREEIYAAQI